MNAADKEKFKRLSKQSDATVERHLSFEGYSTASIENVAGFIEKNIPYIDMKIVHERFEETCPLVIQNVFPAWEDIEYVQCKDGITNKRNSSLCKANSSDAVY